MTTTVLHPSSHRFALPTLFIFFVVLLGGMFYVKPLWDDVSSLQAGLADKQNQQADLQKQLNDLKTLQQTLDAGSEVSKQISLNAIPERFEEDKLITDLFSIAQKNAVTVNGVNFNVGSSSLDKIKRANVNVNVTSGKDALISFLRGIEANERKLVVKSITVQYGKTDTGADRTNFNLNLETYYQQGL